MIPLAKLATLKDWQMLNSGPFAAAVATAEAAAAAAAAGFEAMKWNQMGVQYSRGSGLCHGTDPQKLLGMSLQPCGMDGIHWNGSWTIPECGLPTHCPPGVGGHEWVDGRMKWGQVGRQL